MQYLTVEQVSKYHDNQPIIKDISLELASGEMIALLGTSGVGKTTLFNIIAGTTVPDSGKVYLDHREITGETGHFSYMLQKDLLLEHLKIIDNVSLPLLLSGMSKSQAYGKAQPYFEAFGLQGSEDKFPRELSGGMRQRAAFLRSFLASGEVMLLDEPFSALDTLTKYHLYDWYMDMRERYQLTTLFITHDIDEAILLSDRIMIMKGQPGYIHSRIDLPKNKEVDFQLSSEFLTIKKQVLEALM